MRSCFNPPSSEPRKDGTPLPPAAEGPGPAPDRDACTGGLSGILDFVKEKRAIDFSAHKHGTINRRIAPRLLETGMPDFDSYYRHLSADPAEIDLLLDALTINVSRFFRNPLVFEILKEQILPTLIYFNRELAERTEKFLSGVLAAGGCLVLGEAEAVPSRLHRDLRGAIPRTGIFRKEVA